MAVRIDASGEFLRRTANLPASGVATLSGWVKVNALPAGAALQCFTSLEDTATFAGVFLFLNSSGELAAYSSVPDATSPTVATLSAGSVFWFALTNAGTGANNCRIYYRAVNQTTLSTQSVGGSTFTPNQLNYANDSFNDFINGDIWNVKTWDRVLTAAELLAESYYSRLMYPSSINHWWQLNNANDTVDRSGNGRNPTIGGTLTTQDGPVNLWVPRRKIFLPAAASGGQTLTPTLYTNDQTFYAPTVGRGAVTLTPDLFTNNQTFYGPTASATYGLTPDLFTNGQTFYAPTVAAGTVTLSPALFTNNQTFYQPTITPGAVTISPALLTNSQTFYAPEITQTLPGELYPPLLVNTNVFFEATLTGGGRSRRAGGSGPAVRKGYIIQGKRYYLNQNELAVMLAQMMKEVKRSSVQEIRGDKPANLSRKSWAELKQTLARLNDLTTPKVEESDDDDEDILMLL